MTQLAIVGAGGFGRETRDLIETIDGYELVGFLDDNAALHDRTVGGATVLGPPEWLHQHPEVRAVITVGNPERFDARAKIAQRLGLEADRYATLIHPAANVHRSVEVGHGTVIHAGCVLTADLSVGSHVVMMPNVVLTHDVRIGDFVTFGAGALVAGYVTIGDGAYIGSGAGIRERLTIGDGARIGMGAVVTRSVPAGQTWVGVPARRQTG